MITLLISSALAMDCAQPITRDQLERAMSGASAAYEAADLKAFEESMEQARAHIPCLGFVASPSLAAQLHRLEGLSAFVASDEPLAHQAFGAAKRLEPDVRFPEAWAPEGNPLRALYDQASPHSETVTLQAPPTGSLRLDGRPNPLRPNTQATLYQWVGQEGTPERSIYLWSHSLIPAYPAAPAPEPVSARSLKRPLLIGAGAGVVASGLLFGGAVASRAAYNGEGTTLQNIDARQTQTNGLLVGSGLTLGLSLGAGIVGLVSP